MVTGKMHKFVLIIFFCLGGSLAVSAQSHFLYIQSKNGTPFYVKMNDSLMSSAHEGYLILPRLQKGTYPIIIGFAKKKVPEAAFKISIGNSGDKGFLLEEAQGGLILKDIQNKKILKPEEVATSAGNRILTSTQAIAANNPKETTKEDEKTEDSKDIDSLLAVQNPAAESPEKTEQKEKKEETGKKEEENPFEKMLNAVTGGKTPAAVPEKPNQEPTREPETAVNEPEEPTTETTNEKDSIQTEEAPVANREEPEEKPEKEKKLSFSDIINPSKNAESAIPPEEVPTEKENEEHVPPETAEEIIPQKPKPESEELTFIRFKNEDSSKIQKNNPAMPGERDEDTLITTAKELRKQEKEKEKRKEEKRQNNENKKTLFEKLIEQTNNTSSDSTARPSIARPLISKENPSNDNDAIKNETPDSISNSEGALACSVSTDKEQFDKIRRKIASKKSEETMLRTAGRYFSGENCYSTSQLKELVYLFGSDDYRLQFLKMAYPYCSDKEHYDSLTNALSSPHHQKELRAFFR